METATRKQRTLYRLRYDDDTDNNVMVYPENGEDTHSVTPAEAVVAIMERSSPLGQMMSAAQSQMRILGKQSESLLKRLQSWSVEHSSFICRADIRVQSLDDFLFVVMQKDVPYDFELSSKLTDLDIEVSNDPNFNLITLNVLAIPRCSSDAAQAFIDWENNIGIVDFTCNA